MHRMWLWLPLALCTAASASAIRAADWRPADGPLKTRWAKDVSPDHAHPEYPRPQMRRNEWQNLNGLWDYAIRPRDEGPPKSFDGKILVPFPIESALSGVMKRAGPEKTIWYHRRVSVPDAWRGKGVLLNFEAVDWEANVWIDGEKLGTHRGGYTPFNFDATSKLEPGTTHDLLVSAWDPSDAGTQPCGKQHNDPEGIWYTPSSGIWQTVWMEPVDALRLTNVRLDWDARSSKVSLIADWKYSGLLAGPIGATIAVDLYLGTARSGESRTKIASATGFGGKPISLPIPPKDVRLWSPDSPVLYDAEIRLLGPINQVVDEVESYCALRTVTVSHGPDDRVARIHLNGKPVFLIGPLDQGFWPDGLYTAPTDDALRNDLEVTKKLGFNLIRKHVKVEPARWYYWCDRLGIAVFQDMPSGDLHARENSRQRREITRSAESAREFDAELKTMIDARRVFPCIIAWVPFNEGWGQFDTIRIGRWIKEYDPHRLVDAASGWNDFPVGDVHDVHDYPGPGAPAPEPDRAAVLGEFGGLGLPLPGHLWVNNQKNWGYVKFKSRDELTAAYLRLTEKLRPLVESRLSAAVYTQTTDVETEVNGLMTYDRELIKMDVDKVRQANEALTHLLK
jgi:beta-galactosidase/beta-glucuronidase